MIGEQTLCSDIQTRKHVFCHIRDPDIASRGDEKPIERAALPPICRSKIGGKGAAIWSEAKQETWSERRDPDGAPCIAGHFHEQRMRTWSGEHAESTGRRIEATELVGPRFGEPDHALPIDGHPIGIEGLYARLSGECILPHLTCAWIKPPQAISVEFGKPDIPMPIQSQLVGCAGQQLDLLW